MAVTRTGKALLLSQGMDALTVIGSLIDTCAMAAEGIEGINADQQVGKGLSHLRSTLEHASLLLTDGMILLERGGVK